MLHQAGYEYNSHTQLLKVTTHAERATVMMVGDRLKIVQLDYSPARVGGLYAWAKVAILPQQ